MNKTTIRDSLSKMGPFIALLLAGVFFTICSPFFLTTDNLMNIFRQSAVNATICIGMLMVILTGCIDLSVGAICALASCVMGVLMRDLGIENPVILITSCVVTGVLCGLINALVYIKLRLPHPFIATLGTTQIFNGLALIVSHATPVTGFSQSVKFLGATRVFGIVPLCFLVILVLYVLVHIFLNNTVLGREIYSVGGNIEAAKYSGINVSRVQFFVFIVCGTFCGVAAWILTGRIGSAYPTTGATYATDAIAATIIGGASFSGGKGNIWGTLMGVLLVQVLNNGLNLLGASTDIQNVVVGAVTIMAVFIDVMRDKSSEKAKRAEMAKARGW